MRVLLVDDHAPVRKSLRQLLQLNPDITVVGEGSSGQEALTRVQELLPDVVLMDMKMPGMNGIEATQAIKQRFPDVQVLALTAFSDMSLVSGMVQAGASGYLLKGGSADELFRSLKAVVKGQGALDRGVTRGVIEDMADLYAAEQKRADALAELDRMKSEFVSVVTHELRTPLTVIKGGVHTLRDRWSRMDDATKQDFFDGIQRQCDRLERMIGQILTVSGIRHGGLGLTARSFSLEDTALQAAEALAAKTAGREVALEVAPAVALGDEVRVLEVATSILDNALKFTRGPVTVRTYEAGQAVLEVSDTGPGIPAELLEQLLHEPFRQADSSTTRATGGLGLSLYIARRVLEASGGALCAQSHPQAGSTFALCLPLGQLT